VTKSKKTQLLPSAGCLRPLARPATSELNHYKRATWHRHFMHICLLQQITAFIRYNSSVRWKDFIHRCRRYVFMAGDRL